MMRQVKLTANWELSSSCMPCMTNSGSGAPPLVLREYLRIIALWQRVSCHPAPVLPWLFVMAIPAGSEETHQNPEISPTLADNTEGTSCKSYCLVINIGTKPFVLTAALGYARLDPSGIADHDSTDLDEHACRQQGNGKQSYHEQSVSQKQE